MNCLVGWGRKVGWNEAPKGVWWCATGRVMANLAELDKVAFVRFASVYQNFNKVEDFERFAGAVRTEYPI